MKITEYLQYLLSMQERIKDLRESASDVTIDNDGNKEPLEKSYPLVVQTAVEELWKAEYYVKNATARIASTLYEESELK